MLNPRKEKEEQLTNVLGTGLQRLLGADLTQPVLLLVGRAPVDPPRLRQRDGNVGVLGAELAHVEVKRHLLPVDDFSVRVQAHNVHGLGAGEPLLVQRVHRLARGKGRDGGPKHLDAGAVDGAGDGLPHGLELGVGAVVRDAGVRVEGVRAGVPVHLVGQTEPDNLGPFGEEFVQRGDDGRR